MVLLFFLIVDRSSGKVFGIVLCIHAFNSVYMFNSTKISVLNWLSS